MGDFSDAIKGALDNYASHHNIGELEQQLDNVPLSIIHEARSDSFGIGPILNYLLLKEREAQALRVEGDFTFGRGVKVVGEVTLEADSAKRVEPGTVLSDHG